eukprot:2728369-Prymnesium_polylepis.1
MLLVFTKPQLRTGNGAAQTQYPKWSAQSEEARAPRRGAVCVCRVSASDVASGRCRCSYRTSMRIAVAPRPYGTQLYIGDVPQA